MVGKGILRGLATTARHLLETYIDDVKGIPSRYAYDRHFIKQPLDERGIFTIQYPEERRVLPERFRYVPMLIYDADTGEDRCTACGICAKVCPTQCIWIVREEDKTGKPLPRSQEFYIDISICMGCGFCAEFCPFDSIKMNHDYEIAVYHRFPDLILTKDDLVVPTTYYAQLYPEAWEAEERAREEERKRKEAREKALAAKRAAAAKKKAAAKKAEEAKKAGEEKADGKDEEKKA